AQGRVNPTTTVGGMVINDNAGLEKEADVLGAKALQMNPKENKSRAVANSIGQKKSNGKQGFSFVDNRPNAVLPYLNNLSDVNSQKITQLQLKEGIYEIKEEATLRKNDSPKYTKIRDLKVPEKILTEKAPGGAQSKFKLETKVPLINLSISGKKEHTWCKPISIVGSGPGWVNDDKLKLHSDLAQNNYAKPADFSNGLENDETLGVPGGEFRKGVEDDRAKGLNMGKYRIGTEPTITIPGVAGCAAIRVSVFNDNLNTIILSGWLHSGGAEDNGTRPLLTMLGQILDKVNSQKTGDHASSQSEYTWRFLEKTRTAEGASSHSLVKKSFIEFCYRNKIKNTIESNALPSGDALYISITI
ncbi:hypothetical protein L2764_27180, partial [Shewanella surugensis]|nr:hypothetical protein [Shewanella surugensis]